MSRSLSLSSFIEYLAGNGANHIGRYNWDAKIISVLFVMKQLDRRKPTFKGWLEFTISEKKASFIACIEVNLQLTRVHVLNSTPYQ